MHKIFRISEKRLAARYNLRILLFNIPAAAVILSLAVIVAVFINTKTPDTPTVLYYAVFYASYASIFYSFLICLAGSLISAVKIKAHSADTYIEIIDDIMIISQHNQTRIQKMKFVSYKKLWVIRLKDISEIICEKNHMIISSQARYFNEKADWLNYERTGNGISFDNWWYDSNGGKNVNSVNVTDFYSYGERIAKRIAFCSHKIKIRDERREAFRDEMLKIARTANHPKKIQDRYKPQKEKRVFRP